jgi:ER membrane protein complex subunit 7
MVLMMILPLILLFLLPRIMNDPEAKKEMENLNLPKVGDLDMSEMISKFLGGGNSQPAQRPQQNQASTSERSKNKKRN